MRRAQNAKASSVSSLDKFAGNEGRLDGLPDTHVIRNQHADNVNSERHDEWDKLVRPRAYGELPHRPERASAIPEAEARSVPQQASSNKIASGLGSGVGNDAGSMESPSSAK